MKYKSYWAKTWRLTSCNSGYFSSYRKFFSFRIFPALAGFMSNIVCSNISFCTSSSAWNKKKGKRGGKVRSEEWKKEWKKDVLVLICYENWINKHYSIIALTITTIIIRIIMAIIMMISVSSKKTNLKVEERYQNTTLHLF